VTIRILLADNHAGMRESLRGLIDRQPGMEVVAEAENERTMLQASERISPDVVVMDINVPEIKGVKGTRRVISGAHGAKFLTLSMHTGRQFADEMIKAGARGYLLKDRAFEELVRAIQTVAGNRIYLCPGLEDSAEPESV
jgi:DNA-binding NarL/FixJ family response regulator